MESINLTNSDVTFQHNVKRSGDIGFDEEDLEKSNLRRKSEDFKSQQVRTFKLADLTLKEFTYLYFILIGNCKYRHWGPKKTRNKLTANKKKRILRANRSTMMIFWNIWANWASSSCAPFYGFAFQPCFQRLSPCPLPLLEVCQITGEFHLQPVFHLILLISKFNLLN